MHNIGSMMYASKPDIAACIRTSAVRTKYIHLKMRYFLFIYFPLTLAPSFWQMLCSILFIIASICLSFKVLFSS